MKYNEARAESQKRQRDDLETLIPFSFLILLLLLAKEFDRIKNVVFSLAATTAWNFFYTCILLTNVTQSMCSSSRYYKRASLSYSLYLTYRFIFHIAKQEEKREKKAKTWMMFVVWWVHGFNVRTHTQRTRTLNHG